MTIRQKLLPAPHPSHADAATEVHNSNFSRRTKATAQAHSDSWMKKRDLPSSLSPITCVVCKMNERAVEAAAAGGEGKRKEWEEDGDWYIMGMLILYFCDGCCVFYWIEDAFNCEMITGRATDDKKNIFKILLKIQSTNFLKFLMQTPRTHHSTH
jgi:hypothetical protein